MKRALKKRWAVEFNNSRNNSSMRAKHLQTPGLQIN